VILDIGKGETHLGITYVGCSHVKSFKGLAFNKSFSWERLDKVNKSNSLQIMKEELQRLEQLLLKVTAQSGPITTRISCAPYFAEAGGRGGRRLPGFNSAGFEKK